MSDTTKRIIYKQDDGIVAVIAPAKNETRTVDEIAKKDVPTGKKYKIVDVSGISSDRSFRDAWTVDESDLTDGVGE
jgi:hypothetical protein